MGFVRQRGIMAIKKEIIDLQKDIASLNNLLFHTDDDIAKLNILESSLASKKKFLKRMEEGYKKYEEIFSEMR